LAYVAGLDGKIEKANKLLYESLEVLDRIEKSQSLNQTEVDKDRFFLLLNLGESEHRLGHFDRGLEVREKALKIAEEHGNQVWIAYAHYEIGEMQHLVGHHSLAQQHLLQALELFEKNNARKDVDTVINFLKDGGYEIKNIV
jgi:tetratricopeptide (TPR) repeat protein